MRTTSSDRVLSQTDAKIVDKSEQTLTLWLVFVKTKQTDAFV